MKKLALILLVAVCLLSALSLTSCFEEKKPDSASALWDRACQEMDALTSFKAIADADIEMYVGGKLVEGTIKGTLISSNYDGAPYYYEESVSEAKNDELGINNKTTTIEAYNDGKRFLKINDGKTINQICADFEFSKFESYITSKQSELNPTECTYSDFKENEDGTWVITASGFPSRAIKAFVEDTFDDIGAEVDDIELTVTMNSEYLVTREELAFVFDAEGTQAPSLSYVCEYSEFNSAQKITDTINPKHYIDVSQKGFELLDSLEEQIEEHQKSESGRLKLTAIQEVSVIGGSKSTSKEVDQVIYGVENGGYFYKILASVNGTELNMVYKNGKVTTTPSGLIPDQSITDEEAKANIASLIDSAQFFKAYVKAVKENEDGTFTIEQSVLDEDKYKSLVKAVAQGNSSQFNGATQKITITLDGDKITKIDSTIEVRGRVYSGTRNISIKINVGSLVEFLEESK